MKVLIFIALLFPVALLAQPIDTMQVPPKFDIAGQHLINASKNFKVSLFTTGAALVISSFYLIQQEPLVPVISGALSLVSIAYFIGGIRELGLAGKELKKGP